MKKQKLLSLLLAVTMVLAMIPAFVVATTASEAITDVSEFADGDVVTIGSLDFTVIKTAATLDAILGVNASTAYETLMGNYILGADIDYETEGVAFRPLAFSGGIFDGNGYSIYGYEVTVAYAGTFFLKGAKYGRPLEDDLTIRNLTLGQPNNPITVRSNRHTGAVVADVGGSGALILDAVTVYANTYSTDTTGGTRRHGGLVGLCSTDVSIADCTYVGTIILGDMSNPNLAKLPSIGGFVGDTNTTPNFEIYDSTTEMIVIAPVGDIADEIGLNRTTGTVDSSGNSCNVVNVAIDDVVGLFSYIKNMPWKDQAYNIRKAQLAKNPELEADQIVGYDEENDKLMAGDGFVESVETKKGTTVSDKFYAELAPNDYKARSFMQVKAGEAENTQDVRVLVMMQKADFEAAEDLTLTVTFKTSDTQGKKLVCTKAEATLYWSVVGGDYVYDTPEGYVLLAAEVAGVPTVEGVGPTVTASVMVGEVDYMVTPVTPSVEE